MAKDEMLQMIAELKQEALVLKAVCASLIGEIAVLSPDPHAKLDQIVTSLEGVAAGVAAGVGDTDSKPMTETIDMIGTMARTILPSRK